jgi:small subunit ribosomal protein S16
MLKIKLKKIGNKNNTFYKIVLMENLSKRDGKSINEFGYYDPIKKIISLDQVALQKSINEGAYPTNTVRHLIYKLLLKNKKENAREKK